MSSAKKRVAVVGATGIAGQQFVAALTDHPWFDLTHVVASPRSAGKRYGDALRDPSSGALRWWCEGEPPAQAVDLVVEEGKAFDASQVDLVFSAVEAEPARELEAIYAQTTPVVSTASAFRYEDDVPILVPGVNWGHIALFEKQRAARGWKGFITPNPNCTTIGLALALAPIVEHFGVRRVLLTSMQGISGAGRSPGVVGLDILDNVIPYIPKEEEKVAAETRKIFGALGAEGIAAHPMIVSATCTRAAVLEGHTEAVSVETERPASPEAVAEVMRAFAPSPQLPTSPQPWIAVHDDPFRPQPRLDRDAGAGMTTSVGRLRPEAAFENGIKFVLVSHNTKMGAAKGSVLAAEYLREEGLL